MGDITTIGLDLAKSVFQVHAVDEAGNVVMRKRLRRSQVLGFFAEIPPCLVGPEACATAHHWARELIALGHKARLMSPNYVKAYVKRNKHDVADAEALCEDVRRPSMRFVPVKTAEQQSALMMHRARDLLIRQRSHARQCSAWALSRVRSDRGSGPAQSGKTDCDCYGRKGWAYTGCCPSGSEDNRQPHRSYPDTDCWS